MHLKTKRAASFLTLNEIKSDQPATKGRHKTIANLMQEIDKNNEDLARTIQNCESLSYEKSETSQESDRSES